MRNEDIRKNKSIVLVLFLYIYIDVSLVRTIQLDGMRVIVLS